MTTFKWNITTSADWNTQGAWDQGTVPNGTTADVDFLGSASYIATISAADPAFLVDTLTLNDPNATLAQNGLLTLGGSLALLALDAGNLVIGGTLAGGRIDVLGGDVSANGGTLSGVAFEGSLDLSANNSELTLKDGTSFASAGGTGQATVNLVSQNGSTLAVLGSGTLDNATIDIGSYYNYSEILNEDPAGTGTTLTLGPNLTINQSYYNAQLSSTGAAGDAIVNDGIIDVDYAGDLTTNGPGYRNNGNFVLNATNFTNAGSIAVFNDGLLDLTGRISTALVNSITTSAGGIVGIGGTVTGGTIVAPHGEIGGLGGTLDGVSVQGSLDLSADNSELTLKDATNFAGAGGVGQATINLVSQGSSTLAVLGSGTLDNATIDIGSYYSDGEILNEDTAGTGTTLTLGPNLTINETYYNAQLSSTGAAGDAIVNDGIIDVDYAGDLTTNVPGYRNNGSFVLNATNFTNAGSIAVFNDGLLDLTGRISTALVNSITTSAGGIVGIGGTVTGGTIVAPHGEIGGLGGTLDGVSVQGSLDLSADNSELTLKDATNFAGAGGVGQATINLVSQGSSTLAVLGSGTLDNATIDIGSYYSDGEILNEDTAATGTTLTLGPNLTINETYYNAQLSSTGAAGDAIVNDGTINAGFAGGVFSIGASTFNNAGLMILSQGTVAGPATSFTNQGTISGFGTILPAIIDNGLIVASGGNLDLKAGDPGTGSGLIDPGATLELGNTFGETITFAAGGVDTLALDSPTYATGTLAGLAPGDTIDFLGTIVSHATITGTTLAVQIGTTTFNYTLAAGLAGSAVVVPDAAGTGSDVRIACFCRGTRIRTPDGEIPVEDLAIGDALVTRRGEARRLMWIGRRSYAGRFAAANPRVRPVCIRAGAIAEGVPKRDLYVSPAHAMYLNQVLVPALALVNGTSIVQVTAFDQVDYVHLELATHDVIFAEGAETESYLDDDNRAMFQNAAEYAALYPALPPAIPHYCAERVEQGPPVAAIRVRLAERAVAIGCAPAAFSTQVIRLDQAGLTRAVIAPGVGEVHLVSTPGRARGDRRSLGALFLNLALDGAALPLAGPALPRGFHEVEQHGARQVRWTNGEGVLCLAPSEEPRSLAVEVGAVMGQRMAS